MEDLLSPRQRDKKKAQEAKKRLLETLTTFTLTGSRTEPKMAIQKILHIHGRKKTSQNTEELEARRFTERMTGRFKDKTVIQVKKFPGVKNWKKP